MPTITLERFTVHYPAFELGPFDLAFSPGERVAVIGANGAGKSTTLKAIAGQLPAYGGRLEIDGREAKELVPGMRAAVGYLPESLHAFGWMTVAGHLRFLADFFPAWDQDYAYKLLDRMGLPADAKTGTLSKGMRVKLSLVAAEAHRPPLLVLDEPTSAIDPLMRGELLSVIDECAPAGGQRTVLFSSHILEDVERIAERVVFLKKGRLVADMSVSDIRAREPQKPLHELLYATLQSEL